MLRPVYATLGIVLASSVAFAAEVLDLDLQLVSEVHRVDVSEGHLFHANQLWVGHGRNAANDHHRVEIYSQDGTALIQTINLRHSITGIYPYGEAVIVVGRSASPRWFTHYTVISRRGGQWQQQTTNFAERYQVHEFAGDQRRLYFNEPGSRGIFQLRSGTRQLQSIPVSVSGPGKMVVDDGYLWVIENNGFGFGDENLVRIDRSTLEGQRTFTDYYRNGLIELADVSEYGYLAVSETMAGNVLLINQQSNALAHTVAVGGQPHGLAVLGRCLLTVNSTKQTIDFIDLNREQPEVVFRWNLSRIEQHLTAPRKIAVNADRGLIFVRSTHPCPSCEVTQSSVYRASELDGMTFSFCLQQ